MEEEMHEIVITPESGSAMDSGSLGGAAASAAAPKPPPVLRAPNPPATTDSAAMIDQSSAVLGLLGRLSSGQVSGLMGGALEAIAAKTGKEKLTLVGWKEMFDTDRIKVWGPYSTRVPQNLSKFALNYLAVTLLLTIYAILTTPGLLFTVLLLGGLGVYLLHLRTNPVKLGGVELSHSQKMLGFVSFSMLVIFFTTPASSSFIWVILVAALSILTHALLYQADEERPDQFFVSV